jgi:hypothetical protein
MIQELDRNRAINENEASKFMGRAVQTLRNDRHLRMGPPYIKMGRRCANQSLDGVKRRIDEIKADCTPQDWKKIKGRLMGEVQNIIYYIHGLES